ncbi:DNA-binding transcriptional response regulator, NtrC family, contains REC, AAA-type ATPase, and a Fis-type DNA-binding domains [Balnearium lithotrophicum]|uniref:DNA-binding transcriptional response regulator, NtrC family, contains REC, AAA-type ATPase, and a Fis-type DNA-binding domains n=1 Tax=Balnearium lithotrophicum TaxID=223788 RepID=A0A521B240_9BACT|nr:sigma-54 dependent transcriptional regulator [Balnearium lithotrophicum]SMO41101.1 DNA-binding transcriptional response regulator, NtrC family, contains REC, AAA-type ATPase, and a Fis-type DNA-binding domains [Balnearium lithotrophicum]
MRINECKVLVVEDDKTQLSLISEILRDFGFQVYSASNAEKGLQIINRENPCVVVTDVRLPGMDGLSFMRKIKSEFSDVEVIVITAFSSIEDAVESIKSGAFHYVTKPYEPEVLINLIKKACQLVKLRRVPIGTSKIIYASREMEEVLKRASLFSKGEAPVLILGESGVGKELVAKFIHEESGRKGRFISVNCSAIPRELFESEFFGYERGAFTGANKPKPGLFEEADGGTLFLDEIGELPLEHQPKLLRVLQERRVRRLGSSREKEVDVKIIAATNRNLEEMAMREEFREDLLYRINVLQIEIPPLRERPEDIVELTGYFLKKYSRNYNKFVSITPEALDVLLNYSFPGNVRELENIVHRLVITSFGEITPQEVSAVLGKGKRKVDIEINFDKPLPEFLADVERKAIERALKCTGYVQTRAAKLLGIDEKSLRYKRKKYGI